ncbi:MAG: hypothetical protein ACI9EF_003282 [Pseudohongiellaceae bacterium]
MSLAAGFLVLLLTLATGSWPSARFGRHITGPSWIGRLSLAVALGAAITGLVQIVFSLLGFPAGIAVPVGLAALSLGAFGVAPPSRVGATEDATERPGWPLTAWLAVVVTVSTVVAVGLPFSGDGGKFWAPKSRDLAQHSAHEAPSLTDETQLGFHRGYPLLVPVLMAPAFGYSPADGSAGAKLVLQGLGLALLGLITSMLSAVGRHGRWLAVVVLAMPALVLPEVRESLLAGGYADGADALFLLLFVDLADRLRRGAAELSDGALAVLVGAALVSTKLEGGVEVAIVMIAWLLAGPHRGLPWLKLGCGVALLATPTMWLATLAAADPSMSDLSFLLQGEVLWGRSLPVLAALAGLLIDTSALGLAPLAILVCALSHRPRWGFGALLVLGCLAFFVLVYLSTTMHVGRHLHTSLHRLALHWIPSFALIAARSQTRGC